MVVYHCSIIVTSQALILHRLSVNSSEKAVLLIHDNSANAEAGSRETVDAIFRGGLDLPSIRESGVFEKVIVCDSFSGLNLTAKDIGSYEKRIRESFDGTFAENNITLDDFTAFYTANDCWEGEFKVYLSLNNRKCHIIEATKNSFSFAYFINDSVYKNVLLKHNAVYPDGISDVAVIRNTSIKSIEKYKNKNVEIWDVERALNSLSDEKTDKILKFYKYYNISPKPNSVLMLLNNPRSFHYDGAVKNSDTCILRYYTKFGFSFDYKKAVSVAKYSEQIALSFYVDESSHVYLKHHPRSWFSTEEMQDYFDEKTYSLSPLPIDFYNILPEAQSMKFDKAICFSSSSNQFVEMVASEYVLLGTDFYKSYFYYLKLYSALAFILSNLDSGPPPPSIYSTAPFISQINLLLEHCFKLQIRANDYSKKNAGLILDANAFVILKDMNESPRDSANFICLNEINCEIPLDRRFLFKIEKKALCSNVLDPLHTEYVHFITSDVRVKEAIRKFHLEKNLPFMKIRMSVHSPNIDEEFDIINRINLQYECKTLKYKLKLLEETTYRRDASFAAAFLDLPKLDKLIALARNCSDFESYCDILSVLAKNYLVIAAVKDTPGNNISVNVLEKLRSLGLTDFDRTLWRMYIGVIHKGTAVAQKYAEPTKGVEFAPSDKLFGVNIRISSHAWSGRGGKDKAEIIIDGTDFAVNIRGVNIVIYDTKKRELIDRVAFDWHNRDCVCKR